MKKFFYFIFLIKQISCGNKFSLDTLRKSVSTALSQSKALSSTTVSNISQDVCDSLSEEKSNDSFVIHIDQPKNCFMAQRDSLSDSSFDMKANNYKPIIDCTPSISLSDVNVKNGDCNKPGEDLANSRCGFSITPKKNSSAKKITPEESKAYIESFYSKLIK